jgi:hypothetical protein
MIRSLESAVTCGVADRHAVARFSPTTFCSSRSGTARCGRSRARSPGRSCPRCVMIGMRNRCGLARAGYEKSCVAVMRRDNGTSGRVGHGELGASSAGGRGGLAWCRRANDFRYWSVAHWHCAAHLDLRPGRGSRALVAGGAVTRGQSARMRSAERRHLRHGVRAAIAPATRRRPGLTLSCAEDGQVTPGDVRDDLRRLEQEPQAVRRHNFVRRTARPSAGGCCSPDAGGTRAGGAGAHGLAAGSASTPPTPAGPES